MKLSQAAQQRIKRMEKLARDAINEYNADMSKGEEPMFPDWALDLLGLLDSYDRLVHSLASTNMQPLNAIDFETGAVRDTVVRIDRAPS